MTPKKSSFIKTFGLFLLLIAAITFPICFVNQLLRKNGLASSASLLILMALLIGCYYFAWRWFSRKLNQIEKQ